MTPDPGNRPSSRLGRGPRRRWLVLLTLLGALGVLASGAAAAWLWLDGLYRAPGPSAASLRIDVEPGASVHAVLGRLETAGALRHARAIQAYLRLRGVRPRMLAGTYEIPAGASAAEILEQFAQGRVVLEQLTVVEGARFADFLEALAAEPRIVHTLAGRSAAAIMELLGHPGVAPEGQFFPDTYRFAAGTTDVAVLEVAYAQMQRELEAAWRERRADLPLTSPYQVLILASLVEKEAALPAERPLIAGVFVNRLRRDMRLQCDSTVIYGLGADYDGSLHSRDLQRDTPYNTYTREGLPPTPIALPGRDSLHAAANPADTRALYFVATGLGDGAHHFSETLEAHNSAVDTYVKRLRDARHAAPAPARARGPAGHR